METRGLTPYLLIVCALAFLAAVVVLMATPADAIIDGKDKPAWGDDWIIDQDTDVLNEIIDIQGTIYVNPGYTLYMKGVRLTFNSSYDGEHGIEVETDGISDGEIELEECTFLSDYQPNGWFFNIYGEASLYDDVKLSHVFNGLQIYNDGVTVRDTVLEAQMSYGVYIHNCDPTIIDSTINLRVPEDYEGWGLRIEGSFMDLATPRLDNLDIKVYNHETIYEETSSFYANFRFNGLEARDADLGILNNTDITFEVDSDITLNWSGTPYLRCYFDIYGIEIYGESKVAGFNDVDITGLTYFVDAHTKQSTSGRLYLYNNFYGFYNGIYGSGSTPATLTGITISNHRITYDDNGVYRNVYKYYNGYAIRWHPSSSCMPGEEFTMSQVILDNMDLRRLMTVSESYDLVVSLCNITDNYFYDCLLDMRYWDYDITFRNNYIYNNSMDRNEYYDAYRMNSDFNFIDNDVINNTYYRWSYIYYTQGEQSYEDNLFLGNKERQAGADYFFRIDNIRDMVTIDGNNFTENGYRYFFYIYYIYSDLEITNNEFLNNTGRSWMFYSYYIRDELDFEDNLLENNQMAGGFYVRNNYAKHIIKGNTLANNQFGGNSFFYSWAYSYSGFDITHNNLLNNSAGAKIFEFTALGYWGSSPLTFQHNYFFNNTGSTASNAGMIYFILIKTGWTISHNTFENNSANCIANDMPYSYYYNYANPNHWFYVEFNTFINNSGKGMVFNEIDNCHIVIKNNIGNGNEDYCVFLSTTKAYLNYRNSNPYIYMYNAMQGPNTLRIESNNFSSNPGGALWLKTSCYNSQYSYYNPGNPNQEIIIKKNILMDNGKDGWAIALIDIYKRPSVKTNIIERNAMGQYMELIGNDPRAKTFSLEFRDLDIDGGADGVTAYGFGNIDATFFECSLLNFTECLYAKDCTVTAYWCAIDEASGKTEGKGRIYIWNHLEVWVTWANATGVDSGIAVPDAVVAMRGANGKYFGALRTDAMGKLAPMLINPWTSVDGVMDAWSPFETTIMAHGVSTPHIVRVVGEFIDPNPMRLTLIDYAVPEVIISNPQDDTLVNTAVVLGEGFLFEIGSGIVVFEGQTDEMEDEWEPITQGVIWQHEFRELSEGEHNLSVRAADLSGNWNTSVIAIIVDLTKPFLEVRMQYPDTTPIPYNVTRGGYFIRTDHIWINGTFSDNYAKLREIIIRYNGQALYIPTTREGRILEEIILDQGINTIIVDATDTAGNRNLTKLYISMDSYAPTIFIYSPLKEEVTGNSTMVITGLTEPDVKIITEVVSATLGEKHYTNLSYPDGTIHIEVVLFEGLNTLVITAIDSADNPTKQTINVYLDTVAPDFTINNPIDDPITPEFDIAVTNDREFDIRCTMGAGGVDAKTYIGGQEVPNRGIFNRRLILEEGENTIDIRAIDPVGNERVKWVTIIRDTINPELEVVLPTSTEIKTNVGEIQFMGTVSGADFKGKEAGVDVEGVWIEMEGIPFAADLVEGGDWDEGGTWEYALEIGAALEGNILVVAKDRAGNKEIWSIFVKYDPNPPDLVLDQYAKETSEPVITISGRTTDEEIFEVIIQGVPYPVTQQEGGGAFEVTLTLEAGLNPITISLFDDAGNENSKTIEVNYIWEEPDIETETGKDEGLSNLWGFVLIFAAVTVIGTAVIVSSQRSRRR